MKKLVVFFPSWRYFGHFALPLFEPLAGQYEIIFLHTEQAVYGWNDCPDLSEQHIQAVDLKALNTFSFVTALKKLSADVVVVFDKGWVQDRALLHAARHLDIPSLHIQHGIISKLESIETNNRFQRACAECIKILKTFWLYDATLLQIGIRPLLRSLPFQLRLLLNPNDYYFNYRHEITADLAGIIGERDRTFFVEKEGYREEQLIPMGALQFEKTYAMEPRESESRLLLISQPLFEDHFLEGGLAAKERHLREIIQASPLPVAIKPHPREDQQWYKEHFSTEELLLYPAETDISEAILDCSHVVGYFSTALINAIILNRPVGIVRWVDDSAYVLNLDKDGAATDLNAPASLTSFVKSAAAPTDATFYAFHVETVPVLCSAIQRFLDN